ncbi:MAG: hypothetical protein RI907_1723 [Pseudomonadota bacterium]
MDSELATAINAGLLLAALGVAALFKPWRVLQHGPLQNPWLFAMLALPALWWTQHLLPSNVALHVSGAALMVLMFGWPLAIWSMPWVALVATALTWRHWPPNVDAAALLDQAVWSGVIPATVALGLGLAVRRWLPHHLFVYILGRGFIATALAITATGALAAWAGQQPPTLDFSEWMLGHWLLGWGEAISTGMLTAIFVAFKPHWLLTYSDQRYLPGKGDQR